MTGHVAPLALLLAPLLLAPQAAASAAPTAAPVTPLVLPDAPALPVREVASSPPGARIGGRLRFEPWMPWVLGQLGVGVRTSAPVRLTLGLDVRLLAPVRLYGQEGGGLALAPTGSLVTHGAFPDHATGGLALGYVFTDTFRGQRYPAGVLFALEAAAPFSSDGGAHLGVSGSLRVLVPDKGPSLGLAYTRLPLSSGSSRAVLLSFGFNFVDQLLR
jgi:hypothetical protein